MKILTARLKSSLEQMVLFKESVDSLEREISLLQRNIDLEIINSPKFFEEVKKLEYQIYLDWDNPKLIHAFSNDEKFPVELNKVKHNLSSSKDKQIYTQEYVYFDFPYRNELHICSSSVKDLLTFAKNHKLEWFNNSIHFLNEEIDEAKKSLNYLNKFKRLMEKYK